MLSMFCGRVTVIHVGGSAPSPTDGPPFEIRSMCLFRFLASPLPAPPCLSRPPLVAGTDVLPRGVDVPLQAVYRRGHRAVPGRLLRHRRQRLQRRSLHGCWCLRVTQAMSALPCSVESKHQEGKPGRHLSGDLWYQQAGQVPMAAAIPKRRRQKWAAKRATAVGSRLLRRRIVQGTPS